MVTASLYNKYTYLGIVVFWADPFWLPLLFVLLLAIFLGFFLILRYRYMQRKNLKINDEIEARILQQQQLISELQLHNDQLKISKAHLDVSITEKDRFISILIHDLRSPLRYLYKNTAYLFRNWKRDSDAELDSLITEINNSTQQIHFLTEEMMQWIATQNHTYYVRKREYFLSDIISELGTLYTETILQNGNRLELDIPSHLKLGTDKLLLKTILRNLLDNANKNTDEGFIRIEARQAYQKVVITVSDTGVGVSPALLQAMNQYFNTSEPLPGLNTQFGHKIIRDFTRLLNGTVVYESPESGGLRVYLTLPS